MNKKRNARFVVYYTFAFFVCCLFVYYQFFTQGKTFIYVGDNGDGWVQHYKAYIYYSRYLKSIINNLFEQHRLIIPQWDFSIGEGSDIIGTFHYYVIGDPIAFLSVLVPDEYIYAFYDFGVILRVYLSGLFFAYFCSILIKKEKLYALLASSLTYTFCFWTIINSTRHIYFLNPMMYFPLILAGVEKTISSKSPYLLTFSVAIGCLSNFYFFYNMVVLTVLYSFFRLLFYCKGDIKQIIKTVLILFKYSLLGVGVACVLFLPIIFVFLQDSRLSIQTGKHILYPLYYYKKLPSIFLSTGREYWLCMGYASPVLLSVFLTLKNWRKNSCLFIMNLFVAIMILCPIFGQIMNGLSYISNKWCFGAALLFSFNLYYQWDELSRNRAFLFISFIVFSAICIILGSKRNINIPLIICFFFLVAAQFITNKKNINQIMMVVLIVLCIGFNANNFYTNHTKAFIGKEESQDVFYSGEAFAFKNRFDENNFCRYSGNELTQNASIISSTYSTDYYWSLTNPYISEYRTQLGMNEYSLYKYFEYDQRSPLLTLANVKYYIIKRGDTAFLPHNFSYYSSDSDYDYYINESFIPFGYTYECSIPYDTWKDLSSVEKEECLLKAVVIKEDDAKEDQLNKTIDFSSTNIPFTVMCESGIEYKDNRFIVNDTKAIVIISFNDVANGEVFISFDDLNYDDEKKWIQKKNTSTEIKIRTNNGTEKILEYNTKDDKYYNGRKDFTTLIWNSIDDSINSVELSFSEKGIYSFDSISLTLFPFSEYDECINRLSIDVLENVIIGTNTVSGTIETDKDEFLLLSIPYSKGWKAYVDNEEVDLYNANIAYMALHLNKGNHNIELRYETPLLRVGTCVSLFSLLIVLLDAFLCKKK